MLSVERPGDFEDARRLFKLAKNEALRVDDLDAEDFGLIYLYYPELLPDVDPEVREP